MARTYQVGCNRARSIVWRLAILLAALSLLCVRAASAEVRLPDGEWFEQTDDLRVKVMGGYVTVARTWLKNRWYFNPAWAPLKFTYDVLGSDIATIERTGWRYERRGAGVWAFDNKNTIVLTPAGYRWQDRSGNSIDYDAKGRIQSYADRNGVKVTLATDAVGRITGVFDHFGMQMLWLDYAIAADQVLALSVVGNIDVNVPSAVRDVAGRRVEYRYANGHLAGMVDVLGHEWTYAYDGSGRVTSRTDPENRVTSVTYANARVSNVTHADATVTAYGYDYDSAKREIIVRIVHPGGRQEQMWYGVDGLLQRLEVAGQEQSKVASDARNLVRTDANGEQTKDEFDEFDNLVKRTHADGSVELFAREPRYSQVARYMDGNGNATDYVYDDHGNLIQQADATDAPERRTTAYAYDAYGNRTAATRLPDARTTASTFVYRHDNAGNLIEATDPEGNVSRYTYDVQGNALSFTDPLDRTWRYAYDAGGRLLSETDPLSQSTRYEYDKVGNLLSYVDRRGETWRFEYDLLDRLTARIDPVGNAARTEYDPEGYPVRETDREGRSAQLAYDPLKRLRSITDGRGNSVELRYPVAPAPGVSSFAPSQIVYPTFEEKYSYDTRNRLTEVTEIVGQDVALTRYSYDRAGNRSQIKNAADKATSYDYDALNRLVRITDTLGHTAGFVYDNRDNLVAATDANGNTWRFEYDRANRRVKESKPKGELKLFRYDAADQLVEVTDALGQHVLYDYDRAGRLTTERQYAADPSGSQPVKQLAYSFDAEGNLTKWSDGQQAATLAYDKLGRLSGETVDYGPFSLTYSSTYYANGLRKTLTVPGDVTYSYAYSNHNQLASVELPGEGSITVNDYRWKAPAQITLPGGTSVRQSFDGQLRPTAQQVTSPAATSLFTLESEYGKLRELRSQTLDGNRIEYSYDSELRLLEAQAAGVVKEAYALDAAGNRVSDAAIPGTWQYDESNRLRHAGGNTYEYDGAGNLIRRVAADGAVTRFFYDVTGRLVQIENGAGSIIARYGYDPFGRRLWTRKGDSITYFLYANEGLIGEYNALGQEVAGYGWQPHSSWGSGLLFYRIANRYFYAHTDHRGTPLRLTDKGGNVVWSASYSAFGQAAVSSSSIIEFNLRLPGQYFDRETGLHYNWHRYYDPVTGRYTQSDPIGLAGGLHAYVYAQANPLSRIDPLGLFDMGPVKWEPADNSGRFCPAWLLGIKVHSKFTDYIREDPDLRDLGLRANEKHGVVDDMGNVKNVRPDAFDPTTGDVWELKPQSWQDEPKYTLAKGQLKGYCGRHSSGAPNFRPGHANVILKGKDSIDFDVDCMGTKFDVTVRPDKKGRETGLLFYEATEAPDSGGRQPSWEPNPFPNPNRTPTAPPPPIPVCFPVPPLCIFI